jgi:hypothetical protein
VVDDLRVQCAGFGVKTEKRKRRLVMGAWTVSWAVLGFAVACVVLVPASVAAQRRPPVPLDSIRLGAHVRLESFHAGRRKGTLVARSDSGIVLRPAFDLKTARTPDTTFTFLRSEIERGAVRTGSRWQTGVWAGATALGIVGLCMGAGIAGDEEYNAGFWAIPIVTATGVVAGGAVGAAIGHLFKVWTPIDVQRRA